MRRDHRPDVPVRVLGYTRVSGREQGAHGTSLDDQRQAIERYCAAYGWPKPRIRTEVESAGEEKIERRVELAALINDAREGDAVVVAALDRWSRDVVYAVDSVRKLTRRDVGWIAIRDGIDARTPNGQTALKYLAVGADEERERIRRRTVEARLRLRDEGAYADGLPPYGYQRGDRAARRQLVLEVVPERAEIVREAFARALRESIEDVRQWLQIRAGRKWDKKGVARMLRSRVYLGEVRRTDGTWIQAHEPIIDRALFERVATALESRKKGGRKPHAEARTASWLLRGLAVCARCGSRIGASYSRAATAGGYYACNKRLRAQGCDAPYHRVEVVDATVNTAALAQLRELRHALAGSRPASAPRPKTDPAAVRAKIEAKRARLVEGFAAAAMSAADLRAALTKLDAEAGRLEVLAAEQEAAERGRAPEARRAALANVKALEAAWKRAPVAVRREAIARLVKRIELGDDEPRATWRTAEELAAETNQP